MRVFDQHFHVCKQAFIFPDFVLVRFELSNLRQKIAILCHLKLLTQLMQHPLHLFGLVFINLLRKRLLRLIWGAKATLLGHLLLLCLLLKFTVDDAVWLLLLLSPGRALLALMNYLTSVFIWYVICQSAALRSSLRVTIRRSNSRSLNLQCHEVFSVSWSKPGLWLLRWKNIVSLAMFISCL